MSDETITLDLNAPVRLADLPGLGARVLDWWIKELLAFAPAWVTAQLPKAAAPATLYAGAKTWRMRASFRG